MATQRFLAVGDVFVCPALAKDTTYQLDYDDDGTPSIDRRHLERGGSRQVTATWEEEKEGGWSRQCSETFDLRANEPALGTCEWVVLHTEMSGGGTGHGPHDVYPDGHRVKARRLRPDGTYDPDGQEIGFYQSGCFIGMVEPDKVTITRQMKQTFA